MPAHAFLAFGLFLKVPYYSEILLKNKKQAQCLLKLLLGSSSRLNNNNDEFNIGLSTMPFTSLNELLNSPNSQIDMICQYIVDNQLLTLILSILSTLSHHQHRQIQPNFMTKLAFSNKPEPCEHDTITQGKQQMHETSATNKTQKPSAQQQQQQQANLYWAKGTGFGTGSTAQQWDAERTQMQQKMEEEHVTCILEILSSFIKCFVKDGHNQLQMADLVVDLFDHSCVINVLSSYLRNDSGMHWIYL